MSKRCVICSQDNVQAGHEGTKNHLKNAGLFELEKHKKKFSENRNGIKVTCSATPTAFHENPLLTESEESRLEVYIRPQVEIRFTFTIRNDNTHKIIFGGVVMLKKKRKQINFILHNKNIGVPSAHTIQPKQYFNELVTITFESQTITVGQLPVYFYFVDAENGQTTIIYKEIVVFVQKEKKQEKYVDSPYTNEVVKAEIVVPSPAAKKKLEKNKYLIPSQNHRIVFQHLEEEHRNRGVCMRLDTDAQNTLLKDIRLLFKNGATQNYNKFFHNLLWCDEVAIVSSLQRYNMSGVSLLPHGQQANSYVLKVPGLAEKRPSLMPGDFVHVRPHGQKKVLFESLVTHIEDTCAVFGAFATGFKRYFVPGAKFDIRFFMSRVPLERMHEAIDGVQSSGATSKICPQKTNPPKINAIPKDKYFNKQVAGNPEQRSVVEHVVGGSSGTAPFLVLGPPGTGKTVTIVEAILQLARNPKNRILVCTDSNMAADHVALKLVKYRKEFLEKEFILRANSEFRPWEAMPNSLRQYSNGWKRANFSQVSIARFLNHRIVITTLIHAAKFARELKDNKCERKMTHLFIDEAAQASEPAALVPVCGLLARGRGGALVLAGDPRQLGPFCASRAAKACGLGASLMERLKRDCELYSDENPDPNLFIKLKTTFRSHADILSIPNELFYNGELTTKAQPDRISCVDILGDKESSRAIVFHGVLSREQRDGKSPSFYNDMEAEIVTLYAEALVNEHKVAQKEIGVITPYIKQVYRIMEWLEEAQLTNIEVGTVEAFQGREKRVIILSCVRANSDLFAHDAKFQLGFLDSAQRFNVALTRAKAKLIVIGNPLCLKRDEKWMKYMQKCREFRTYTGFDDGVEFDADLEEVLGQIAPITKIIKEMHVSKK